MPAQPVDCSGVYGVMSLFACGSDPAGGNVRSFGQAGTKVLVGDTVMPVADRVAAALKNAELLEIDVVDEVSILAAFALVQAQCGKEAMLMTGGGAR